MQRNPKLNPGPNHKLLNSNLPEIKLKGHEMKCPVANCLASLNPANVITDYGGHFSDCEGDLTDNGTCDDQCCEYFIGLYVNMGNPVKLNTKVI